MNLYGIEYTSINEEELYNRIRDYDVKNEAFVIEGLNFTKLIAAISDVVLADAIQSAQIVHIDGIGISILTFLKYGLVRRRWAGIDIFTYLLSFAEDQQAPVYFLGASETVLEKMTTNIREKHPRLPVAGKHHGYFGEKETPFVIEKIQKSNARILFLGMPSPMKECFVYNQRASLKGVICMGVGGSFDVLSGLIPRSPTWIQKIGGEWIYRCLREPRRLTPRYMVSIAKFIGICLFGPKR